MQVKKISVLSDLEHTLKINEERIQFDGTLYNFANLTDGQMVKSNEHIISTKRIDGELYITCVNYVKDVTQEEIPQWQTIERNDVLDNDLTVVDIDWYSDDDRASDELLSSLQPTLERLAKAERDLETIELLIEMGLI